MILGYKNIFRKIIKNYWFIKLNTSILHITTMKLDTK